MNIAIVGLGTMGNLVFQEAKNNNINIVSTIDPCNPNANFTSINQESMHDADVCICFTTPESAFDNICQIAPYQKKIVMATTGWLDKMEQTKKIIDQHQTAMIYSSNFSLGVNIFFQMLKQSAQLINQFDDYDILGYELHHNRKQDSPSGTAKTIENIILEAVQRKTTVVEDKLDRRIENHEFHYASIRGGDIPGTHTIQFESSFDSIEIKHTARNRLGFAKGSLLAAQWIMDKQGIFTEKDLMTHYLG